MCIPYNDAKPLLRGLSRKDQYKILLNTTEWKDFRQKNIDKDNRTCMECGHSEGDTEIEVMTEDECKKRNSEIDKFNELLRKKWEQTTIEEFIYQILNGTYEGLSPNVTRFGGKKIVLNLHHKRYYWNKLPWEYSREFVTTLCYDCHLKEHADNKIYTYKDETMTLKVIGSNCNKCGGTGYLKEFYYYMNGVCFECGGSGNSLTNDPKWTL